MIELGIHDGLLWRGIADHPLDAEFIRAHSEIRPPELIGHRLCHAAALGKSAVNSIRLRLALHVDRQAEIVPRLHFCNFNLQTLGVVLPSQEP